MVHRRHEREHVVAGLQVGHQHRARAGAGFADGGIVQEAGLPQRFQGVMLLRDDGTATYHLASVVDDADLRPRERAVEGEDAAGTRRFL